MHLCKHRAIRAAVALCLGAAGLSALGGGWFDGP